MRLISWSLRSSSSMLLFEMPESSEPLLCITGSSNYLSGLFLRLFTWFSTTKQGKKSTIATKTDRLKACQRFLIDSESVLTSASVCLIREELELRLFETPVFSQRRVHNQIGQILGLL